MRRQLLRWLSNRADQVFVYTEPGRQALIDQGLDSERITVVQNTIDTSALRLARDSLTADEVSEWSEELGLGPGPVFGFVGALDRAKGVDLLLDGWDIYAAAHPDASLLIAGDGPDRPLAERLRDRHPTRVHLLGYADETLKARIGVTCQSLIVPGQIGLVAVDALVLGLPLISVVGAHHGPEIDYLEPGQHLFLCAPQPNEVAVTMARVADLCARDELNLEPDDSMTIERMAENFAGGLVAMRDRTKRDAASATKQHSDVR
jgi:glycosyltransferase involved in cell wall biosynthesis